MMRQYQYTKQKRKYDTCKKEKIGYVSIRGKYAGNCF